MGKRYLLIALILMLAGSVANAQQVEFNYEGRVLSSGIPYSGPGYFKFAIVDKAGTLTLWSNDGTSTAGDEPAAAIVSDVTDGVFNVIVGDVSGYGMEPLDASLFNVDERVKLRVWFSDSGAVGSFEQLNPDRAITNPGLLGAQSYNEIEIFVDPISGNDKYPGNYDRPKQTIQAAWDTLPSLIRKNATIHLRDGVYREEILLTGKTAIGDATIAISGNITSPTAVRITGADAGAETTPVRDTVFRVRAQKNLLIEGVQIDYSKPDWSTNDPTDKPRGGLFLIDQCSLTLRNCLISHHNRGLYAYMGCYIKIENCEFADGIGDYPRLITVNEHCFVKIINSYFHHAYRGICMNRNSSAEIQGITVSDIDTTGLQIIMLSNLNVLLPQNTVTDCGIGIAGSYNSVLSRVNTAAYVQYSGNGSNVATEEGTVMYDPWSGK